MEIYLPSAGTLGCMVWPGAGVAPSQGIPPNFYLPHANAGQPVLLLPPLCTTPCLQASPPVAVSMSLLLLPSWMSVASLNCWFSDFHTVQLSDCTGWCLFRGLVVILSVWHEEVKHVFLYLHLDQKSPLS